ncbi:MAG: hypothetical protein H3C64_15355, partial [Candidatus Kuenenia stuttgartiensis]|nr:hypothetical protein [Candidatus Kuenenia stuttgartiensis]
MIYQGEHLLIGQFGHFCVLLSFVASIIATFAYFRATQAKLPDDHLRWKKLARSAFIIETVAVLAIFVSLYAIIYN